MRRLLIVLPLVATTVACGSSGQTASPFWDASGDVRGSEAIYSSTSDLSKKIEWADAAVVLEVTGVESIATAGPIGPVLAEDPADQARVDAIEGFGEDYPRFTTYKASVQRWLKGGGASTISIIGAGGYMASTKQWVFLDGMFLLEPGRTYLLLLQETPSGDWLYGQATGAFDLTGGVHVLNHPITRDLERLEQMSVEDFTTYVTSLVDTAGSASSGTN
jgi:hypothetical protein